MIEKQLYISNELEQCFGELRTKAAEYVKESEFVEGYANFEINPHDLAMKLDPVQRKFASNTGELMDNVMKQIEVDVSKLRSRIEI